MLRETALLYEPMIERDAAGIRAALRALRRFNSSEDLLGAVVRFAVLAFCPSQHSRSALAAAVAATTLAPRLGTDLDSLITECAIYAADSRAPWSEPPIGDPPALDDDATDALSEIAEAIRTRDRLRGERWLAKALEREDFGVHFFDAATLTLAAGEQGMIVAVNAWRVARGVPRQHWYATLRVAIEEWTRSGAADEPEATPRGTDAAHVLQRLVRIYEQEDASPLAFQLIALFDASEDIAGVAERAHGAALAYLLAKEAEGASSIDVDDALDAPLYRLARDYAAYLQSVAIAERLQARHDRSLLRRVELLAHHNLLHGDSYEEWSLA